MMKKYLYLLAFITFITVVLYTCAPARDPLKQWVGIALVTKNAAGEQVQKGIEDELMSRSLNVDFDVLSADGDVARGQELAKTFIANKERVVVSLGKALSESVKPNLGDIPHIALDDLDAKAQILWVNQLAFLKQVMPSLKSVGMVYIGSPSNPALDLSAVEAACLSLGLDFKSLASPDLISVAKQVSSLAPSVDLLLAGSDIISSLMLTTVGIAALEHKTPVVCADFNAAVADQSGAVLIAWQLNNYKLGRAVGRQVADLLIAGSPSKSQQFKLSDVRDMDVLVNRDAAQKLGIDLSPELLQAASHFLVNGQAILK